MMRFNRWIFVPLIFALLSGPLFALTGSGYWLQEFLYGFMFGAVQGLVLQVWSEYRTNRISRTKKETDFSILQSRNLVLLLNYENAFDLCENAIKQLGSARIKEASQNGKFIKAKTSFNFHSFGTEIKIELIPINKNLTELQVSTRPSLRTIIVDYGESLKTIEELTSLLKERDAAINKKVLAEGVDVLKEVYIKPFQKELS